MLYCPLYCPAPRTHAQMDKLVAAVVPKSDAKAGAELARLVRAARARLQMPADAAASAAALDSAASPATAPTAPAAAAAALPGLLRAATCGSAIGTGSAGPSAFAAPPVTPLPAAARGKKPTLRSARSEYGELATKGQPDEHKAHSLADASRHAGLKEKRQRALRVMMMEVKLTH